MKKLTKIEIIRLFYGSENEVKEPNFQWKNDAEIESDLKKKTIKEKISDEVADIMLYLLRFSDLAKIDIEKCCLKKIKKNEKKYPVSLSKGKSTKYNLLKK